MAGAIGNKDDYSLEPVPQEARRSWKGAFNTTIGMATALFFMQVGSLMSLNYGIANAVFALVYATVLGGIFGYAISYVAAKTGMSSHLIGKAAGFGFIGVAFLSLIYGLNSLMYFSVEGSIMSISIQSMLPNVPLWFIMLVVGLLMIPLSWYGISIIEKFQKYTLYIYLIMLVIAFGISYSKFSFSSWTPYLPENMPLGETGLLSCIAIMNGVIAIMALNTADFSRFIKKEELKIGVFFVGVVSQIFWFLIAGLMGIWFGMNYAEANPGIYFVLMLGIGGTFFAVVTQIRINLGNLYLGSVSFSNFFSQIFKFRPGRSFFVVVFTVLSTISMIAGLVHYMEFLITLSGVFLMALLSSMLTDIYIVRKMLKLGPEKLEHRESHLPAWNPVGITSLVVSSAVGVLMILGMLGEFWVPLAAIFSGIINTIIYCILSIATKGRYYHVNNSNRKENENEIVLDSTTI